MDVVMPQLGETVTEGTVTKWYKKVGDAIKADEALFDVETDKVSTEIPAPVAVDARARLSPVVSRLIAEHGLDARAIAGTGRDGRITREDVLAHVAQRGAVRPAVRTQEPAPY